MPLIVDILTEADLHAYVDGRLEPERRRAVEAHLGEDPAAAQRVRAYQRQVACLHALFGRPPAEPLAEGRLAPLRAATTR